jgi:hypothetical protein
VGTLRLATSLESRNFVGGNFRGSSGWKYRKLRSRYLALVQRAKPLIPTATGKRQLWVTRYYAKGKREYDTDNLYGGCKPLLDVLVSCGMLRDDKTKWLQLFVSQKRSTTKVDEIVLDFFDVP